MREIDWRKELLEVASGTPHFHRTQSKDHCSFACSTNLCNTQNGQNTEIHYQTHCFPLSLERVDHVCRILRGDERAITLSQTDWHYFVQNPKCSVDDVTLTVWILYLYKYIHEYIHTNRGADKSLGRPDRKTMEGSPLFFRRQGHCCRGNLVGRTTFLNFFRVACKS